MQIYVLREAPPSLLYDKWVNVDKLRLHRSAVEKLAIIWSRHCWACVGAASETPTMTFLLDTPQRCIPTVTWNAGWNISLILLDKFQLSIWKLWGGGVDWLSVYHIQSDPNGFVTASWAAEHETVASPAVAQLKKKQNNFPPRKSFSTVLFFCSSFSVKMWNCSVHANLLSSS